MRQFRWFCLSVLLIGPLAGCFPFSAMDAAFLILSLPVPDETGKVDMSGYSLGPISSDGAQELILSAVPAIEGEVYFTGRAQWTGLENVKQPSGHLIQSIVAITDFQILFIWWRESDERYKILIRLPYSDINSVGLNTGGLGAVIWFCHEDDVVLIGDKVISIDRKTRFNFLKSGIFGDTEKTKEAFLLLDKRVMPKEGLEHLPSPCEDVVVPGTEHHGFGEDDFTGQP